MKRTGADLYSQLTADSGFRTLYQNISACMDIAERAAAEAQRLGMSYADIARGAEVTLRAVQSFFASPERTPLLVAQRICSTLGLMLTAQIQHTDYLP